MSKWSCVNQRTASTVEGERKREARMVREGASSDSCRRRYLALFSDMAIVRCTGVLSSSLCVHTCRISSFASLYYYLCSIHTHQSRP